MTKRLNSVIEELKKLTPISESKYVIDMVLGDEDEVIGISIKCNNKGNYKEILWLEEHEDGGLDVELHPEVDEEEVSMQDVWTILYCLSANMKKEDSEIWSDLNTSEIAEFIYESRRAELEEVSDEIESNLKEKLDNLKEGEEIELPEEIEITIDTELLAEVVKSYKDIEDAELVIDFVNTIAELSGLDIRLGVTDEEINTTEEGIIYPSRENTNGAEELGLMDTDYTIKNLSALINTHISEKDMDKDTLLFLNQLIYERIHLKKLIQEIFSEED